MQINEENAMHNIISTNLRNFINTFEFRLNVFNDGDEFISVDMDLNGVEMLLREVDVRRSCNRQDRGCDFENATNAAVNKHLNSLEHELLEIKGRLEWEVKQAKHGKWLSDENTRLMPIVDKKVTDLRVAIRKEKGLFA